MKVIKDEAALGWIRYGAALPLAQPGGLWRTHGRKATGNPVCAWFVALLLLGSAAGAEKAKSAAALLTAEGLKKTIPQELHVTKPDYVVFVPQVTDAGVSDTGNEHFLVFDGPDGSLMAVWTQSSREGQPDQHITFARSTDEGATWSAPRIIAGAIRWSARAVAFTSSTASTSARRIALSTIPAGCTGS